MGRKRTVAIVAAFVLVLIVAFVAWQRLYRPSENGDDRTIEQSVSVRTVMFTELVGQFPKEAEKALGYPGNPRLKSPPRVVNQDNSVNSNNELIVTSVCYSQPEGQIVFEVANPSQVSADDLAALRQGSYESRLKNIEVKTGCRSNSVGLPVDAAEGSK